MKVQGMGILIWVTNRCVYTSHVLMYIHEDTCFLVPGSGGGEGGEGIMRICIWVTNYYSHELMFITLRYTSHVLMYIHEDVHIESCRVCRHSYESRTNVYTWVTNKCIDYMSHEQMYIHESRTDVYTWVTNKCIHRSHILRYINEDTFFLVPGSGGGGGGFMSSFSSFRRALHKHPCLRVILASYSDFGIGM